MLITYYNYNALRSNPIKCESNSFLLLKYVRVLDESNKLKVMEVLCTKRIQHECLFKITITYLCMSSSCKRNLR